MSFKSIISLFFVLCVITTPFYAQQFEVRNPDVIPAIYLGLTQELRNISPDPNFVPPQSRSTDTGYKPRGNWQNHDWLDSSVLPQIDPALQQDYNTTPAARNAIIANFEGQSFNGVNPPDPTMDVGPNHVIAMINAPGGSSFVVYDKSGTVLSGPMLLSTLTGINGIGDPIIIYDHLADRWMLSEFASSGNFLVIAVSQTPDPLGAWYMYSFSTPSFPDYPKYAIWPDAYYVTSNENNQAVYAIDRTNLLAGLPATMQRFSLPVFPTIGFQAATPVNLSGSTLPGATQPGLIMRIADDAWSTAVPNDRLEIYDFVVDFTDMNNSSLTGPLILETDAFDTHLCGYTSFSCFPQPGSATTLDPLREVLMNKVYYRNFNAYEAIVASHVTDVDATDHGGVRWYELRRTPGNSWSIYQQGTYAPDGDNRWMSTIAINADGSIGLAYNVSSGTTFPSIRYTGRTECDPLGTMSIVETEIATGGGSNPSNRYGDYGSMSVDESTGVFWFTGEYNPTNDWSTRIAAFDIPFSCSPPTCTSIATMPADNAIDVVATLCGANGLTLNWTASDFVSSYEVYFGTTSGALTLLGSTGGTSFDIPGNLLAYNTEYFWQIIAINAAGMSTCSEWSFTTGNASAPNCSVAAIAPTNDAIQVIVDPVTGVDLTWEAVCDATSYDVYGGLTAGSLTLLGNVATNTINLNSSETMTGMPYYWQVIPINAQGAATGCSEWSFTVEPVRGSDDCAGALAISCDSSPLAGSTIDSTVDAEYINCGASGDNTTERGVWYKYIGDDQEVTITTCDPSGIGYDTRLTVYSGTCNTLSCVIGNDDMTPACPSGTFRSEVKFNAFTGTDYYIFVHGYQTGTGLSAIGDFNLHITCEPLCTPIPSNEDCNTAFALTTSTTLMCNMTSGDNSCAIAPVSNPSCFSSFATLPDVWYSFQADFANEFINISLGTALSLGYAVYDGCNGTELFCISSVVSGANNEITGLTPGNTYYIQVFSSAEQVGTFDICVFGGSPPNNDCGNSIDIINTVNSGGDILSTTINANGIDASESDCTGANTPGIGVWYNFAYNDTSPSNLSITAPSGVSLFIYVGGCDNLICVPEATGQGTNTLTFEANDGSIGGQNYYLYVSDNTQHSFTLNIANNSLPIELSHFSGRTDEKANVLEWSTTTEINSRIFVVERSISGRNNWLKLGEVVAAGYSNTLLNYNLMDNEPITKAYYRLRSINNNGSFQFSNTIVLERKVESTLEIYPVPATESIKVAYQSTNDEATLLTIRDVAGREVYQISLYSAKGLNESSIVISQLSSGIYFITLDNKNMRVTSKMVKE